MGWHRRIAPLAAAVAIVLAAPLGGCEDDVVEGEGTLWEPRDRDRVRPEQPPPLYDAAGDLLPSGEKVAGLELPRGIELAHEEERSHTYHSEVPLRKLQEFFGTRLVTGEVDRLGDGAVYRSAVPRDVSGGVVRMDVSILPMRGGKTRVEIVELPPEPAEPPSESEYLEALERDMRRWE